jgi:hypothetical protein
MTSLQASLQRELEAVTRSDHLGRHERLRWLRDQLENYLDRWLAFANIESIPSASLFQDDLFTMVIVAADVFEAERRQGDAACELEAWTNFKSIMLRVQTTRERPTKELRDALDAVGAQLR